MEKIFITGTDTDVGKTMVALKLLNVFNHLGFRTIAMKPVATGCQYQNGQLINHDAIQLQQAASIYLPYNVVNPFAFIPAVSPDIAAKESKVYLTSEKIQTSIHKFFTYSADVYLIEGIGGWYVPINNHLTMAGVIQEFNLLVILVVGIKLGCINHALLTVKALLNDQAKVLGWIANCLLNDNMFSRTVIDSLKTWLKIPYLATIPYQGEKK